MDNFHKPVLLQPVIDYLNILKGRKYIDATVGGGGHAFEILKRGGIVLGIDQDQEALDYVRSHLPINYLKQIILVKGNFRRIKEIAKREKFEEVDGILFDLGVSNFQLEQVGRGFSLNKEAVLDMRMDKDSLIKAVDIVNNESFTRLRRIFQKFGEEPLAEPIALAIIKKRKRGKIVKTTELANLVAQVYCDFKKNMKKHPATRVFQALRIAVNDELASLEKALSDSICLLKKGGRLLVISYHSLEDRLTKLTMREYERSNENKLKILTNKPIMPSWQEIRSNYGARSAKLRIAEKL